MATEDDQAALSVFHEINGDTYRLSFWRDEGRIAAIEMSTQDASNLADAILSTLKQAGAPT